MCLIILPKTKPFPFYNSEKQITEGKMTVNDLLFLWLLLLYGIENIYKLYVEPVSVVL